MSTKAKQSITLHPPWQKGLMGDVGKSLSSTSYLQGSLPLPGPISGDGFPYAGEDGLEEGSIKKNDLSDSQLEISRWFIEFVAQYKYTLGIQEDDLPEAMHRMVVDLLDEGHTPSREMLRMISGELQEKWWPVGSPNKQRQHSKESAFVYAVQQEINYRAADKYGNARGARTKAEQDVAEMRGLSVEALRKRLERFRARLKKREAALEQRRKRPLRT